MAEVASKTEPTTEKVDNAPQMKQEDGYKIVAMAADLTGRAMIDEMFLLGAYTVMDSKPKIFGQYIMPYREIGPVSQRTHGVRIYNSYFGQFRVLCNLRTQRILRTKSEYATLIAFMKWLKVVKGNSKGIILVHHGHSVDNLMPYMLQALDRYKLANDFYQIVHGCVNCKTYATDLPVMKDRSLTMLSLLRRVLEFGDDKLKPNMLQSARVRCQLLYKIVMKILNLSASSDGLIDEMALCLTQDQEREVMAAQQARSDKIRTLRPIFLRQIRGTFKERNHAALLRRYLIELGVDYETLKTAHAETGKEGIVKIVGDENATGKKKKDTDELIDLIFNHFENPEAATAPVTRDINANVVRGGGRKGRRRAANARKGNAGANAPRPSGTSGTSVSGQSGGEDEHDHENEHEDEEEEFQEAQEGGENTATTTTEK